MSVGPASAADKLGGSLSAVIPYSGAVMGMNVSHPTAHKGQVSGADEHKTNGYQATKE